ncbi:MAG TPA: Gfo/Idh/MocA family oxidoreductase [Tepidisphaeraceae bacterium]|nr:Gfo/Idh/MocA family oxidoreductase [Tepidisphaeraceae bacterium]
MADEIRLGCIGIDSSHLSEFTKRIKALNESGSTTCRVTQFWTDGKHDWPNPADIEKWSADTLAMGVTRASDLDKMLSSVDGVLVLAVNGNKHKDLALPALERGLPTYIDKPMTCSLEQAKSILAAARKSKARAYSASSLRFVTEIPKLDFIKLGKIVAIDAYGAGETLDMMPDLWHYGCHSIEMVDAVFKASGQGPGVARVSAVRSQDRHLVDYEYRDGRYVRMRLERKGTWSFGATVHGEQAVQQFVVDFAPVYTRLVEGMVRFFEGGEAPVSLRDIVENIAVMEKGNQSIEESGAWVEVPEIV